MARSRLSRNGLRVKLAEQPFLALAVLEQAGETVTRKLATQYKIPDRLLTGGFGAIRPVETNDTLERGTRNRRVELVRE